MKMVRGLLLGAAAGFVAMSGAQAADLPVKAKPVQYVKICDLYGAGFYYIPGTDTCIKLGGFVRFNAFWDDYGAFPYSGAPAFGGTQAYFNRATTHDLTFRSRVYMTGDVRSQTAYGTLRSYYAMQFTTGNPSASSGVISPAMLRGFIQFAGFTVGRTTSLFDTPDADSPVTNNGEAGFGGSTGPTGIDAVQYTFQLGNGVTASVGLEGGDQRARAISNISTGFTAGNLGAIAAFGATSQLNASSSNIPEIVGNLTVSQAWGTASLVGALHHVGASYYNSAANITGTPWAAPAGCGLTAIVACGSPSDTFGYALGGAFTITQIPGMPGDVFGLTALYSHGASGYTVGQSNLGILKGASWDGTAGSSCGPAIGGCSTPTVGWGNDASFINGQSLELTDAWTVEGSYLHRWSPTFASSLFADYTQVTFSSNVKAVVNSTYGLAGCGGGACNPDWTQWRVGSQVIRWDPVPNLNIGLDVIYWGFNTGLKGASNGVYGSGIAPYTGANTFADTNLWTANLQITRVFWP